MEDYAVIQYLDWIGYISLIVGLVMISQYNINGWLVQAFGSFMMILFGLYFNHYGIVFGNIIFMAICLHGYFNYKKLVK